ncbi:hypothetical protein [Flavobacterium sp.]|uniref:hypothetical protein n=1 Tax=Flavobacterium sp. TaxID=239 RepID=UPI0031DEEACA
MKKNIKILFNIFYTFYRVIRESKFQTDLELINDSGECYILGNGPSLKYYLEDNLDFLKKQKTFAVNLFVKSEYYEILRPNYYVLADPNFWLFTGLPNKIKVEEDTLSTLNEISRKTSWPLTILIPYAAKKYFAIFFKNHEFIKIVCYNNTVIPVEGFDSLTNYLFKKNLASPRIQNVLIAAIYASINIGFEKINVFGADHSWTKELFVNDDNQVGCVDDHFYHKETPSLRLYTRYDGVNYKMHELLRDFAYMFEGYHILKKYADYKGAKIYNRSKGSFIDAFERKESISNDNI